MASITVPGLLRPALGLVGWTFVMEAWMYATRLPAMSKYNVNASPDTVKDDMDKKIPGHIKWKGEILFFFFTSLPFSFSRNSRESRFLPHQYEKSETIQSQTNKFTGLRETLE